MKTKKNLIIALTVIVCLAVVFGIGYYFWTRVHRYSPEPSTDVQWVSETDPKRALRLFGKDLFISYFQNQQEELSDIGFTLELPWDGSGYVSEKDSWKRLTERAAYEDKDVIYLNAWFSLSDSGYETSYNAAHYGDVESIEINGIKVEYSVYDILANPLWPDAIRGEFEYKKTPFTFCYSFGSYYNKKLRQEITEEQRQEMLNKAWDRITALLTV